MSEIEATGHELWVPVPLDCDPEGLQQRLVDRFDADPEGTVVDHAAMVAGVARRLIDANASSEETAIMALAAWALVEEPDTLRVRAFATFRVAVMDPGTTADEVARGLVGTDPMFQEPVSRTLDTLSGEAVSMRIRPMVDEDGASRVHELAAVLWSRPETGAWYVLSTYSLDLVEAAEVGELLDELAAGISGL
jgi:hypothetical protein